MGEGVAISVCGVVLAYWSATVFDFSCLAGILSLQASTCEFLRGSQPLKASHLSFQLLENSLSIDAYLCPCTENSDSIPPTLPIPNEGGLDYKIRLDLYKTNSE